MTNIKNILTEIFKRVPKQGPKRFSSNKKLKIPVSQLSNVLYEKQKIIDYINIGKREEFSPQILRLFQQGHQVEEYVLSLLMNEIKVSSTQCFLNNEFLSGKIDCLLTIEDKNYICDVKSMNDRNFELLKWGNIADATKVQIMAYIWLWRQNYPKQTISSEGVIIAFNKNTADIKIHLINYDDDYIQQYLSKAKEIWDNNG